MKSLVLGALCFVSVLTCWGQNKFTISGYIKDVSNGEALIGATVFVNEISNGVISNVYGFYSITLPEGSYTIDFKYVGFNAVRKVVALNKDTRLDMELITTKEQLEEVIITDKAIDENVLS